VYAQDKHGVQERVWWTSEVCSHQKTKDLREEFSFENTTALIQQEHSLNKVPDTHRHDSPKSPLKMTGKNIFLHFTHQRFNLSICYFLPCSENQNIFTFKNLFLRFCLQLSSAQAPATWGNSPSNNQRDHIQQTVCTTKHYTHGYCQINQGLVFHLRLPDKFSQTSVAPPYLQISHTKFTKLQPQLEKAAETYLVQQVSSKLKWQHWDILHYCSYKNTPFTFKAF
jgi:hypothetical protein